MLNNIFKIQKASLKDFVLKFLKKQTQIVSISEGKELNKGKYWSLIHNFKCLKYLSVWYKVY